MKAYTRREFLKQLAAGVALAAVGSLAGPKRIFGKTDKLVAESAQSELYVLEGTDYARLLQQAVEALGGINKYVKKGSYVVIKPNASWSRTPEEAGNTHPVLVAEMIKLCREAGAAKVDVIDHACDNYKSAFRISGVEEAVKKAGGKMIALSEGDNFSPVRIAKARKLKKADVAKQILAADCFINMPIAKDHSAATLTMAMKNYMGVVKNRWAFHQQGLNQCIADISSFVKPDLVLMDCTRILLTNGPKGPGEVKVLNKIVAGHDHVAVDAFGTTLFGLKPEKIEYIRIAGEMGIGQADLEKIKVIEKKI